MAVMGNDPRTADGHGRPVLRPGVCVGQIVQHERLPDGRYNLLLQGICRARIQRELEPQEGRLYRMVMLEPADDVPDESVLAGFRTWVESALFEGRLSRLTAAADLIEYVRSDDLPTPVLIELLAFTILDSHELRYGLLAEPNPAKRASMVRDDLARLDRLLQMAEKQRPQDWPKGVSWN
jgi:hypothetical protein